MFIPEPEDIIIVIVELGYNGANGNRKVLLAANVYWSTVVFSK